MKKQNCTPKRKTTKLTDLSDAKQKKPKVQVEQIQQNEYHDVCYSPNYGISLFQYRDGIEDPQQLARDELLDRIESSKQSIQTQQFKLTQFANKLTSKQRLHLKKKMDELAEEVQLGYKMLMNY